MATWKDSVRVATTGTNIKLTGTQTIDGVQLNVGDRVLVKDQTSAKENGIYVVAAAGWSRAPDANTSALIESQMVVRVSEGNVNGGQGNIAAGTEWTLVTPDPITPGKTPLVFAQTNLLQVDLGQLRGFQGNTNSDADIFTISNNLQEGQSDNPQAYLAASLAGYSALCTGVHGRNGNGSMTQPAQGVGVYGDSDVGNGVYGTSGAVDGIKGESQTPLFAGVFGTNSAMFGYGVHGECSAVEGVGVYGTSFGADLGIGVYGWSDVGTGVVGFATGRDSVAVRGDVYHPTAYAGWFNGNVQVEGTLSKASSNFQIDHPLDPANKYLRHAAVESDQMKNLYDGVAKLNRKGEAEVRVPRWFASLNRDLRYQLTPIGGPAPNLHIGSPLRGGKFRIAGGKQGLLVSWQVTGVRQDRWAKANPLAVEAPKDRRHRGKYLHPALYGRKREEGIGQIGLPKSTGALKVTARRGKSLRSRKAARA